MSDDSTSSTGRAAGALGLLALVAVVLTAGVAVWSGSVPGIGGSTAAGITETELASLETQAPRCGTHRSDNSSTFSRPADGGYKISINETLPVAARDSTLEAEFRDVGPNRYLLNIDRTAGNRSTDCFLEMRFNATVNMTQRDDYTMIVTVDRTYHSLLYADPGHSGAAGSNLDPRPPSMNDSEWKAALDASDAYFENHTDGSRTGSGDDGTAAGGGSDPGDESGGASGGGGGSAGSVTE